MHGVPNAYTRVIIITALIALAAVGWVLLPGPPEPIVKAAVANVVLAGELAAVTTWYALLTRQIAQTSLAAVAEARTQREAGLRPVLIFEWGEGSEPADPTDMRYPVLGVRNVGPGPALNVRVLLGPPTEGADPSGSAGAPGSPPGSSPGPAGGDRQDARLRGGAGLPASPAGARGQGPAGARGQGPAPGAVAQRRERPGGGLAPGGAPAQADPYPVWSGMALAPGTAVKVEGLLAEEFERGVQAVGPSAVLWAEYRDVFGNGWRTHAGLTVFDSGGVSTGGLVLEALATSVESS
jgi:hypothetical protein